MIPVNPAPLGLLVGIAVAGDAKYSPVSAHGANRCQARISPLLRNFVPGSALPFTESYSV
jgi:hypothetical protein